MKWPCLTCLFFGNDKSRGKSWPNKRSANLYNQVFSFFSTFMRLFSKCTPPFIKVWLSIFLPTLPRSTLIVLESLTENPN